MCIIILDARDSKDRIPKEVLRRAFHSNPDGLGLMYGDGKRLITFRSLNDFEGLWSRYCTARNHGYRVALHFRIATVGTKTEANCHPFTTKSSLGVMHNGTITPLYRAMDLTDERSDSQYLTQEVLDHLPNGFTKLPGLVASINSLLDGDRLLLMDYKSDYAIMGGAGSWLSKHDTTDSGESLEGVWVSHSRISSYMLRGVEPFKASRSTSKSSGGGLIGLRGGDYERGWGDEAIDYSHSPSKHNSKLKTASQVAFYADIDGSLKYLPNFSGYITDSNGNPKMFTTEGFAIGGYEEDDDASDIIYPVVYEESTPASEIHFRIARFVIPADAVGASDTWWEAREHYMPFFLDAPDRCHFSYTTLSIPNLFSTNGTDAVTYYKVILFYLDEDPTSFVTSIYPVPGNNWYSLPPIEGDEDEPEVCMAGEADALCVTPSFRPIAATIEMPDGFAQGITCHVCSGDDTYVYPYTNHHHGVVRGITCLDCAMEYYLMPDDSIIPANSLPLRGATT